MMKYLPQALLLAALGVLITKSFLPTHDRSRMAVTLAMQSGHVHVRAEMGGGVFALSF